MSEWDTDIAVVSDEDEARASFERPRRLDSIQRQQALLLAGCCSSSAMDPIAASIMAAIWARAGSKAADEVAYFGNLKIDRR